MRKPTKMELIVARALAESMSQGVQEVTDDLIPLFMMQARAAIRAMRKPTNDMVEDGSVGYKGIVDRRDIINAWQAMIDAASPPDA